jgi:XisI protein
MDKVKKYKTIVKKLVEYIASISPSDEKVETQLIVDDQHGHYLLYSVGWETDYREYGAFVHIDVKSDGKVWLQHDGTDLRIALMLADEGIPKKDIVLGFHAPYRRELLPEFAMG